MSNSKFIARVFFFCLCAALPDYHTAISKETTSNLERKLEMTIAPFMGTVGIAVADLETNYCTTVNNDKHYPMQSVYKFPLAMCVLNMADRHILSLDSVIYIKKDRMDKKTWSPLYDKYPDQDINISLLDLLNYSISKSDNNACDILFNIAGGTGVVNRYVHNAGINDMAINATEAEMHSGWQAQYTNWCRPSAMLALLKLFYEGKLLSKGSNSLLMKLMTESENSANRIKGLLPAGTVVAHKTGTSGANTKGLNAATNDVGIITLPNGHHIAIVVYVSNYKGGTTEGEQMIAKVAKCVWDYYTDKKINTK